MLIVEIDDVRAFVAVAGTGSVSAAARELFRTQPAVTRRLQRLEQDLGARLVDRRRRPFTLTAAGRAALDQCRRLLASVHELRSAAGNGQEPAGELRIGIAHALTGLTLDVPADDVQQRFPKVMLRFGTGWSSELAERVRQGALDGAFILLPDGEVPPASVQSVAVADERLVLVGPASRRRRGVAAGIEDLADKSWILNPEGCAARALLRHGLLRAGHDLRVAVETYDYELQLSLVARGRGLGLVPARLLARSRFRHRVRALRVRGLEFGMTIWAVRGRPAGALEPVVDELTRVLGARLAPARSRSAPPLG